MRINNFKKIIFIGLILLSIIQIIQYFSYIPDIIYGGLIGVTLGIMLLGLLKSNILKKRTTNR